jgi:DNA-binding CsgD family transcriptional regulator
MLVGRTAEVTLLHDVVERAFSGHAMVVLIEGEPGVGKSALLAAAAGASEAAGGRAFTARCDEVGRGRPFGPLLDAVHDAWLPAVRRLRHLAQLGQSPGPAVPLETGPELRSLLVEDLVTEFEEQLVRGPLALCVDDIHWADGATLLALGSLVRRVADLPLLLVVTARPGSQSAELETFLDVVGVGAGRVSNLAARLELAPLDERAVAALAETQAGGPLGPHLTAFVSRCGGNPLLVVELISSLRDAGLLRDRDGVIETSGDADGRRLPATLGETVRSRMARLQGESQAVATVAALLGARFTTAALAAVTKRSATDLVPLVSALVRARVVVDDGDALAFRHDLVRAAIVDALPTDLRAELHQTIAQALKAAGAPLQQVADHIALGAAPGSMDAVGLLQDAAGEIVTQDPSGAVSLLRRALELCPPTAPQRDALLASLVDALAWNGRVVEAQTMADEVLTRPVSPDVEERLRSALGRSLLLLGRPHEAIRHEERLVALHEERGRSPAWALAECAICRLFGLDIDGAIDDAARVSEVVAREPDPMAEILGLCVEVFARNALGETAVAVEIANRAVTLADATPAGSGHRLHPNLFRGIALLSFGERAAALAAFRRGRQLGEALGAAWALPIYHFSVALAHWDTGEWDDLLAEVNAGIAYGEEQGSSIGQVWAFAIAGRVHLYRGNLDAAAAELGRGDAVLGRSGLQVGADWLALSRALLLEGQARRSEGVELLRLVWETAAAFQATASLTLVGGELARMALETGDEALAERVVSALGEIAARTPHDRIVGARERRARGLARRDPEPLLEAVGLLEAIDHRFEAALVRAEAGDLLAAAGRSDDAALLLDASLTFFESMGAHAAAERARSRVARLRQARRRGPAPRRAVAGWDALTPTEWEVVEEVCAGRSNGQVAERLGVSRRTVEAHLRSIYTKLGVSTRLALAVAQRERSAAPASR